MTEVDEDREAMVHENVTRHVPRDPSRRDRLIDVAIEMIAARGVSGATHRAVAQAAKVPLGSTTYYFATLEDLHAEAIKRHADNVLQMVRRRLEPVLSREEFIESVTALIIDDLVADRKSFVVTVELYSLATRNPTFFAIADEWVRTTRDLLTAHVDRATADAVDAYMEGVVLHCALSRTRFDRDTVRRQLARLVPVYAFRTERSTDVAAR